MPEDIDQAGVSDDDKNCSDNIANTIPCRSLSHTGFERVDFFVSKNSKNDSAQLVDYNLNQQKHGDE